MKLTNRENVYVYLGAKYWSCKKKNRQYIVVLKYCEIFEWLLFLNHKLPAISWVEVSFHTTPVNLISEFF